MSEDETIVRPALQSGFALKGLQGIHKDKVYPVSSELKIGREQDNDIVVNEGFVSRYHALLSLTCGVLTVTDNQSSNGTCINGHLIGNNTVINFGDVIKFDVIEFLVVEYVAPDEDNSLAHDETKLRIPVVSDTDVEEVTLSESKTQIDVPLSELADTHSVFEQSNDETEETNIEIKEQSVEGNDDATVFTQVEAFQSDDVTSGLNLPSDTKTDVISQEDFPVIEGEQAQHEGLSTLQPVPGNEPTVCIAPSGPATQDTVEVATTPASSIDKPPVVSLSSQETVFGSPPSLPPDSQATLISKAPISAPRATTEETVFTQVEKPDATFSAENAETMDIGSVAVAQIKQASSREMANSVELLGITHPVANRTFKLREHLQTIGRSPFNDIILKSSSVSSQHAEIEKIDDQWIVRDLESSNGTYVNGEIIEECEIFNNDSLIFGEVELAFDPKGVVPAPDSNDRSYAEEIGSSTKLWIGGGLLLILGVVAVLTLTILFFGIVSFEFIKLNVIVESILYNFI